MSGILLYVGGGIIFLWGIGHLIPTRNIVSGFGDLSPDNHRILTMEWLAEGLTLCFLGIQVPVVAAVVGPGHEATRLIAGLSAGMLFVMAGLSALTGARTSIIPMKLCPFIKSAVGIIYLVPVFL